MADGPSIPQDARSGCCAPLWEAPLEEAEATELANVFKALADPVRLRILSCVASASPGEVCVCDLPEVIGRSQPTVSHHLALLVKAGLLSREKRGRWVWFSLDDEGLAFLRDALAAQEA
ncbi:MAG: helix-turn-helix transcriptional regulator [Actinomycetia bacterium]|nr:helix-turn-helix transcriptional regulator [Actinomycetes bacterium]MCP3910688.1 helix-turn-helix transcriptional regulator [Actinomycetes bacterium]MCP4084525.1 helix-turn-helix transcriptional regulator [Actinomycetes bacterium]